MRYIMFMRDDQGLLLIHKSPKRCKRVMPAEIYPAHMAICLALRFLNEGGFKVCKHLPLFIREDAKVFLIDPVRPHGLNFLLDKRLRDTRATIPRYRNAMPIFLPDPGIMKPAPLSIWRRKRSQLPTAHRKHWPNRSIQFIWNPRSFIQHQ